MKMKYRIIVILILVFTVAGSTMQAQKYITKNANIRFYSDAPAEKIEAINNQVNCALDASTGDLVFKVLMQSFQFEKALMQEHFNENYVESPKFPNATFMGKIEDINTIDFSKNGKYDVVVNGNLTMHGVTKPISEKGTVEVVDGKVIANSKFTIAIADYDIKVPSAVVGKISEKVEITVNASMEKYVK
jgi:polyisoprenoid-binding protein YceI